MFALNTVHRLMVRATISFVARLEIRLKRFTQPARANQVFSTLADLNRSKAELIAENMFLRQQLIVLDRQVKRPLFTQRDRQFLVLLASRLQHWRSALLIVKPDTLLRWHRLGFKLYWRRKSGKPRGRPPVAPEIVGLIKEMAVNNRTWHVKRIYGELLKLNIKVSRESVRKYVRQARRDLPPINRGQSWKTFINNHAHDVWACDFLQTYDLFFRAIFVFFIIEVGSRRVVHYGVTRSPSDLWVAQQLREATPYNEGPRFLIRDNDKKYGASFDRVASGAGIEMLRTPVCAPKANAVCERFIGSVRRECLDHILVLNERHLHQAVGQYVRYFNHARPHQGIDQRIPDPKPDRFHSPDLHSTRVIGYPVLGGLHHDYRRVA